MYKEVAFDPACMASLEYYGLLRQHFGYDHGRYVSADVKAWAREAMQSVKQSSLQPVKRKSISNFLNKLAKSRSYNEFHLTADRKKIAEDNWINWHNAQIDVRPFSLAVSESRVIPCINIEDINDGCVSWRSVSSVSVERNAKDIVDVLEPLIAISSTITIIDPYFRLSKNETLSELIKRCANYGVTCIKVATSMETKDAAQIYSREYKSINTVGISFCWIKVLDKYFHDRYFITDIGAIRSGQGFMQEVQKGTHADRANLNIIAKEEAERTLNELQELLKNKRAVEILRI